MYFKVYWVILSYFYFLAVHVAWYSTNADLLAVLSCTPCSPNNPSTSITEKFYCLAIASTELCELVNKSTDEMLFRNLLVDYNTEEPMIFGHRFKYFGVSPQDKSHTFSYLQQFHFHSLLSKIKLWRFSFFQGYMAGGSGYVLSKAALSTFVAGFVVENIVIQIITNFIGIAQRWKIPRRVLTQALSGVERMSEWVPFSLQLLCSWRC